MKAHPTYDNLDSYSVSSNAIRQYKSPSQVLAFNNTTSASKLMVMAHKESQKQINDANKQIN